MKRLINFASDPYLLKAHLNKNFFLKRASLGKDSACIFVQAKKSSSSLSAQLLELSSHQQQKFLGDEDMVFLETEWGPVCVLRLWRQKTTGADLNEGSPYSNSRDLMGRAVKSLIQKNVKKVDVIFDNLSSAQICGSLVGLEIAQYTYKSAIKLQPLFDEVFVSKTQGRVLKSEIYRACSVGSAVNLSRHLVNLPPNELHPESFSQFAKSYFQKEKGFQVNVWKKDRLKKENMNLLLAVGEGAKHEPALVHIRYRGRPSSLKTVAFVGKGVTFDSGGLNLKPSQSIRLMKKDMGGSASVFGFAHWVKMVKPKQNFDFYLALAENAISANSFRPGDVLTSRSGQTVEIDNTDAEGRLVLADAIDVAVEQSKNLSLLIDLATLTGSTRVGVGAEIAGLYCNDEKLSSQFQKASLRMGDPVWRLPLYNKYFTAMKSDVADFANAASGYGGGIRAALFLQKFIKKEIPWAHFDFHAWVAQPQGVFNESGGNGQLVQCLVDYFDEAF